MSRYSWPFQTGFGHSASSILIPSSILWHSQNLPYRYSPATFKPLFPFYPLLHPHHPHQPPPESPPGCTTSWPLPIALANRFVIVFVSAVGKAEKVGEIIWGVGVIEGPGFLYAGMRVKGLNWREVYLKGVDLKWISSFLGKWVYRGLRGTGWSWGE